MNFGSYLRVLRKERDMLLRELASAADMDTALLSKIERGRRRARKEQVTAFAKALNTDPELLCTRWLADQVYDLIKDEQNQAEILRVAEEEAEHKRKRT